MKLLMMLAMVIVLCGCASYSRGVSDGFIGGYEMGQAHRDGKLYCPTHCPSPVCKMLNECNRFDKASKQTVKTMEAK